MVTCATHNCGTTQSRQRKSLSPSPRVLISFVFEVTFGRLPVCGGPDGVYGPDGVIGVRNCSIKPTQRASDIRGDRHECQNESA